MESKLRVLILDDVPEDAELIKYFLKKEDIAFISTVVGNKDEFILALSEFKPDLILSDFSLPRFTGLEALDIIKERYPAMPFIIITGSLNEETAVRCIKAGAWDYLLKNSLTRLGSAVKSAIVLMDERKKNEQALHALRESEKMYRSVVENASDIIFITDCQGNYRFANSAGLKISGYSMEEILKMNYVKLIIPDYKKKIKNHFLKQLRSRVTESFIEYPFKTRNGDIVWLSQKSTLLMEGDTIKGLHHVARDITEQKKTLEALIESESENRAILNALPDMLFRVTSDGKIVDYRVNDKKRLYAPPDAFIGKKIREVLPVNVADMALEAIDTTLKNGTVTTFEYDLEIDGQSNTYEARTASLINNQAICLIRDITQRKQMEDALRHSKIFLDSVIEHSPHAMWISDKKGTLIKINQACCDLLKVTPEEVIGKYNVLKDNIVKQQGVLPLVKRVYDHGEIARFILNYDTTALKSIDVEKTVAVILDVNISPVLDKNGRTVNAVIQHVDISERVKAEEELRKSEARFRNIFHNTAVSIWEQDWSGAYQAIEDLKTRGIVDFRGYFDNHLEAVTEVLETTKKLDVNDTTLILYGAQTKAELLKPYGTQFVPEVICWFKEFLIAVAEGKTYFEKESVNKTADGRLINIMIRVNIPKDKEQFKQLLLTVTDITESKRDQEKIQRNETRLKKLVDILQHPAETTQEFLDYALEQALQLTGSKIGYIYHYDENTKEFILSTWSREVMTECSIMNPQTCYELDKTGVWGEAVRQRRPIIINDYSAENPLKKGYPVGHVALKKFMTVPIFKGNDIVGVIGLANKETDYDETDILQVSLLMEATWKVIDRRLAEQKLTLFRSLIDQTNDSIEVINSETGRFVDVNEKGCRELGYTREEYLMLTVPDVDPSIDKSFFLTVKDIFQKTDYLRFESFHRRKDGSVFPVEVIVKYVHHDKDYLLAVARDITDRKQAEETLTKERNLLHTLIENIPDYIYVKDTESRILIDNVAHRRALGAVSFDDVKGKTDFDFLPKEIAAMHRESEMQVIATDIPMINQEEKTIDPDGNIKYLLSTKVPLQDKNGVITGIVGISHDITKRKQTEKEREQLLRWRLGVTRLQQSLLEMAPLEDKLHNISDSIVTIFGADFCRIWLIRPADLCERGCYLAEFTEGPRVCQHRDKCLHLLSSSGRYTDSAGATHRRVPFDCCKIGRIASGVDHKFITNDVQNDPRVHDHEWARERGLVSFAGYRLHVPDGEPLGVLALFSKKPIRPEMDAILDGLSASVAMVIQQSMIEDKRREADEKLHSIFNASPDAIAALDLKGKIIDCNQTTMKMFGYDMKDELLGKNMFDFVEQYSREKAKILFQEIIEKDFQDVAEYIFTKKSGMQFPAEVSFGVIHDQSGKPQSIVILSKDITERKKAEQERIRLETVIEQTSEIIIITDVNGIIQYVNPAFTQITGFSMKETIGRTPRMLKSGRQDEAFYKNLWNTILSGNKWSGLFINKKKNGSLYSEKASISPVKDDHGVITNFVAVKRDVTNELLTDQRLRETQKMEAIGMLAGGIAHDFNNILSAIIGYTELSLDAVQTGSQLESDLKKIFNAGTRARNLINHILTFSRQREQEKRPILITPIIKETVKLLRASIPSTIDIRTDIKNEIGTVLADPTQIHQVIMNLCTNAAHAMQEKGGILEIALSNKELDTEFCLGHPGLTPGKYLKLMVSDTGCGIRPEIIPRIFEPYFTTKDKSGGTGLGLSVVHGIVSGCNGIVTVYSEVGKGTAFKVYLPIVTDKPVHDTEQKKSIVKGHEHILLVDDEPDITDVGKRILEQLGYSVTIVNSSMTALELFQKDPNQFDLVITDMTMPFMTGDELTMEFLSIRQDIPIIVCTGYSEKITEEKALSIGIRAYLGKPLLKSEMAETVRRILDEHQEDSRNA